MTVALLLAGCAAERGPIFDTIVEPPVASLSDIAPSEIARVAMSNNNCPQAHEDGEGDLVVSSCGRAGISSMCTLEGDDARFVATAMREIVMGGTEQTPTEQELAPTFAIFIQLRNGRMFAASIPSKPQNGDPVAIRGGSVAGTISAADLARLQAIAGRAGCLNPPKLNWEVL